MARLQIDAEMMIMALQSHDGMIRYATDLQTGEVVMSFDDSGVTDEQDEQEALFEAEPERFRWIRSLPSRTGFKVMERFVEERAPESAKDHLRRALEYPKPFRRFKDALFQLGPVREDWFQFEEEQYIAMAREWLEEEEIEAELVFNRPVQQPQP